MLAALTAAWYARASMRETLGSPLLYINHDYDYENSDSQWQVLVQDSERRFGRAVALAIDKHDINESLYFGRYHMDDLVTPIDYDPELANQLLDPSGISQDYWPRSKGAWAPASALYAETAGESGRQPPAYLQEFFDIHTARKAVPPESPEGAELWQQLLDYFARNYVMIWPVGWIGNIVLRGDFGSSFTYKRAVGDILAERVPRTMAITLAGLLLAWLFALPIGTYSAVRQH